MRTTANVQRKGGGDQTAEIGTYTKANDGQASNQGDHYYHYICADWFANRWMLVVLNRQVQHQVGQDANTNWPEDPDYAKTGTHYFDGLTRFYFTSEYGDPAEWGNNTYDFADYEFSQVDGEPDTLVSSVTATYSGSNYEVTWAGPKNVSQSYTVYYSTSSMKKNGLASGTNGGTTSNPGNSYTGVFWASPSLSQPAGGMYFAIQPQGSSSFTEVYLPAR